MRITIHKTSATGPTELSARRLLSQIREEPMIQCYRCGSTASAYITDRKDREWCLLCVADALVRSTTLEADVDELMIKVNHVEGELLDLEFKRADALNALTKKTHRLDVLRNAARAVVNAVAKQRNKKLLFHMLHRRHVNTLANVLDDGGDS